MIAGRYIAIALVRVYQIVFSPLKGMLFGTASCCRFAPTCSCYAIEALRAHGLLRGAFLTGRRLLRCQPWGGAGYDPVPSLDGSKHDIPPSHPPHAFRAQ